MIAEKTVDILRERFRGKNVYYKMIRGENKEKIKQEFDLNEREVWELYNRLRQEHIDGRVKGPENPKKK